MKQVSWAVVIVLVLGFTAIRLTTRWREEAADQKVSLLVDWSEVRDFSARQAMSDDQLLQRLRASGANALLVGASTIQDYLSTNPSALAFSNRVVADTVKHQLEERGVVGSANWSKLKDVEVGFNPELLGKAKQAGFHLVLRVNNDPWLTKANLFADLQEIGSANQELGVLLNTDEVPGGMDALPQWATFLESQNFAQLLFEFHPAKSSVKLGFRSPRSTYRAHTIASNELKDLPPGAQKSRWRRAAQERACRFLLLHVSPTDSLPSYLENISEVREDLLRQGWTIAWPVPRLSWTLPSFAERQLAPVLALLLAILFPIMALQLSLDQKPWTAYVQIVALTLGGASVVAAVAQNPWTRIEVVPFRGIKFAFAAAWLGSFAVLFPWKQIKTELAHAVRRVDILVGLIVLAVIGYLLLRMGNASAGWKAGWEQGFRDRLEDLLVARPRFKEFAIGYPLLLLGLNMPRVKQNLGHLFIGIGMIGPISMVNTFCHLHSPLYLAYWRSVNGFLLGTLIGAVLLFAWKWKGPSSET